MKLRSWRCTRAEYALTAVRRHRSILVYRDVLVLSGPASGDFHHPPAVLSSRHFAIPDHCRCRDATRNDASLSYRIRGIWNSALAWYSSICGGTDSNRILSCFGEITETAG